MHHFCRGEHELEFKGSISKTNTIHGPVIKLCVVPDPNNPVKLNVEYNNDGILRAGDIFPGLYSQQDCVCMFVIKITLCLNLVIFFCMCSIQSNCTL